MNSREHQEIAELEHSYWWHVGRQHIVCAQLKRFLSASNSLKILNIGCGTGGTSELLEKFGTVVNIDSSSDAIRVSQENGLSNLTCCDARSLPFANETFDLIVALDVIEHIDDDRSALNAWKELLKPGGRVFLAAPAYVWLWSGHDEVFHHYRRYTTSSLHILLNRIGMRVINRTYAITFVFPLIVLARLFSSMFFLNQVKSSNIPVSKPINWLFIQLLKLEGFLLNYINFPFGTSVIVVGARSEE